MISLIFTLVMLPESPVLWKIQVKKHDGRYVLETRTQGIKGWEDSFCRASSPFFLPTGDENAEMLSGSNIDRLPHLGTDLHLQVCEMTIDITLWTIITNDSSILDSCWCLCKTNLVSH